MATQRMPPATKSTKVWRITADAPQGAWVDAATIPASKDNAPEFQSGAWLMSSFDLQYGAEIKDVTDTVPEDLLDQLFPPKDDSPNTPGK